MVFLIDPFNISSNVGPKCPHNSTCDPYCKLCTVLCPDKFQPEYGVIIKP